MSALRGCVVAWLRGNRAAAELVAFVGVFVGAHALIYVSQIRVLFTVNCDSYSSADTPKCCKGCLSAQLQQAVSHILSPPPQRRRRRRMQQRQRQWRERREEERQLGMLLLLLLLLLLLRPRGLVSRATRRLLCGTAQGGRLRFCATCLWHDLWI